MEKNIFMKNQRAKTLKENTRFEKRKKEWQWVCLEMFTPSLLFMQVQKSLIFVTYKNASKKKAHVFGDKDVSLQPGKATVKTMNGQAAQN